MIEQRSPEWFAQRLGKVTASKVADVMATGRGGAPSASRKNYMAQLVTERLTGLPTELGFTNAAMERGTDLEPVAAAAYAFKHDTEVEEVGFIDHPEIQMFGASPDRTVGTEGLIEIKCPNTATHIGTLTGSPIDKKYHLQMQVQMACTGRQWCDFVSFDDRLPAPLDMIVIRVDRDDAMIAEIEAEVRLFLDQLDDMERQLREMM